VFARQIEESTMSELRARFGRPLRLAIVGGGPGAWIGEMHRTAAELDGHWRVVGGVFSSDAARSRSGGVAMGFDPARSYGDVAELLDREKQRADGAEAIAIMTPNDTHYPYAVAALDAGLDVVGDKPVTHDAGEARDLVARTKKNGRIYAIAHGYSAYPMTRYARQLVRDGALGALGLATRLEDGPASNRLAWILDPQRSGLSLVMSAIGCHAQHLACFTSGLSIARVAADARALVPGRKVVDYTSALIEFEGGARGTLTVTQAAAGGENDIRLRIYGEKGMLDWSHRELSYLRLALQGEPARVIGRGDPGLPPQIMGLGRAPRGHPEGLREAFANIYREVAQERMARALGEAIPDAPYPRIEEGAHTMAFIEACVESQRRGTWVAVESSP